MKSRAWLVCACVLLSSGQVLGEEVKSLRDSVLQNDLSAFDSLKSGQIEIQFTSQRPDGSPLTSRRTIWFDSRQGMYRVDREDQVFVKGQWRDLHQIRIQQTDSHPRRHWRIRRSEQSELNTESSPLNEYWDFNGIGLLSPAEVVRGVRSYNLLSDLEGRLESGRGKLTQATHENDESQIEAVFVIDRSQPGVRRVMLFDRDRGMAPVQLSTFVQGADGTSTLDEETNVTWSQFGEIWLPTQAVSTTHEFRGGDVAEERQSTMTLEWSRINQPIPAKVFDVSQFEDPAGRYVVIQEQGIASIEAQQGQVASGAVSGAAIDQGGAGFGGKIVLRAAPAGVSSGFVLTSEQPGTPANTAQSVNPYFVVNKLDAGSATLRYEFPSIPVVSWWRTSTGRAVIWIHVLVIAVAAALFLRRVIAGRKTA